MTNVSISKIACQRNICRRRGKKGGRRDGHRSLLYKYFHISQKLVVVISFFSSSSSSSSSSFFCIFFSFILFLSRRFSPQVGNNRPQSNENLVNPVLFSFHHASFTWVSLRHEDEEGGRKERRIIKLGEGWTRDVVGARLSKYRKYIITLPKWHVVTWSDCISLWPTACSTGSRRRANSPRTCLP